MDRFLAELSAAQYDEWMAYFLDEPFGWHALNWAVANLAAMVSATHGGTSGPDAFMPRWERDRPAQTAQEQAAALKLVKMAADAKDKQK